MLGYIIKAPVLGLAPLFTGFSLFFLACGAAALNNYQDRQIDRTLPRTCHRPLPANQISPHLAMTLSLFFIVSGLAALYIQTRSILVPMLGLAGVIFYNGIYTPLKRKTILAVIPGVACGMVPPLIGWVAAGGAVDDLKIWIVMSVFGVWQVPHFWLILLADRKDYRYVCLPNMLGLFSINRLKQMLFVWVAGFAWLTLLLPLHNLVTEGWSKWLLITNALALVITFGYLGIRRQEDFHYRRLFLYLNLSLVIVVGAVIFNQTVGV
jgi:protoheme IX farnesyltransferase